MAETFDAIVIGLGGFGSSTLYELAKRGHRVLGIEQFETGHARGSSHGETRIIRRAYFEHPDYIPLLDHTFRMWRELESESGTDLMTLCGLVMAGPADGEAVPGVLLAKQKHGIAIDELSHAEAAEQFPTIRFDESHTILGEQEAGYLRVDDCVTTHIAEAIKHGGMVRSNEPVVGWTSAANTVEVRTEQGTYHAAKLVIAGGAWSPALLPDLDLKLTIFRKPVFWFPDAAPTPRNWPVFYVEDNDLSFYGLPGLEPGEVKVAEHSRGHVVIDPSTLVREITTADSEPVSNFVSQSLRDVNPTASKANVCMYCMSPDGHFYVDRHPAYENVVVAAGFSGHGFKFTPVIGAAIADITLSRGTTLPVDFLGFTGRL